MPIKKLTMEDTLIKDLLLEKFLLPRDFETWLEIGSCLDCIRVGLNLVGSRYIGRDKLLSIIESRHQAMTEQQQSVKEGKPRKIYIFAWEFNWVRSYCKTYDNEKY